MVFPKRNPSFQGLFPEPFLLLHSPAGRLPGAARRPPGAVVALPGGAPAGGTGGLWISYGFSMDFYGFLWISIGFC